MPRSQDPADDAERRVWDLLTTDFSWVVPPDFDIQVFGRAGGVEAPTRLQLFELVVALIFARLRPEYDWYVTPNTRDGGTDFVGEYQFLKEDHLGIAALVRVGGQCKKRTRVDDLVHEISGTLVRMADTIDPAFFVVAFSARLDPNRVEEARAALERRHQRHCHILDRHQIEGLIHDHLTVVRDVVDEALVDEDDRRFVIDYFTTARLTAPNPWIEAAAPEHVLAGVPFVVKVDVRSPIVSDRRARLWWTPGRDPRGAGRITLIGPVGCDSPNGFALAAQAVGDDPVRAVHTLEFVSYAAGDVDLGDIRIGLDGDGPDRPSKRKPLGTSRVVENLRPRFFERPFHTALRQLDAEFDRATAGSVASVAVVGAGGSGKSRMCEEFCLEKRRRGAGAISAKQAKTLNDPYRVLAEMLFGLTGDDVWFSDPAEAVIGTVGRYDPALADSAAPTIRSIFGTAEGSTGRLTEQTILSSLVVLIAARRRRGPLIVHLQDLHWCSADVLLLLERLIWQLDLLGPAGKAENPRNGGVLFLLEGRIHEKQGIGGEAWSSAPFEAFLQKLDCLKVHCPALGPEDGREFIRRLFEDRHSVGRLINERLLGLQNRLIERIDDTAGGNPFHSLEQVRVLKEGRILGQNPETGLLYMIQPEPVKMDLPDSVFDSIQLRWEYLKARRPDLGLLLWAAALLEDRLPIALFRRLRWALAPDASLRDVDRTDILWTGEGEEREATFRHEHYFQSLKRFEVSRAEREQVVAAYSEWFEGLPKRTPADSFRWARLMLEKPEADVAQAQAHYRVALRGARRRGDVQLARRISAAALDLAWGEDAQGIPVREFLRLCDEELALARHLLGSDRHQAAQRLDRLRDRVAARLSGGAARRPQTATRLKRYELAAEVVRSKLLYNNRQPAQAAEIAEEALQAIRLVRSGGTVRDSSAWATLEVEALHAHAVGLALSGEGQRAYETSERAVAVATEEDSSLLIKVLSTHANILIASNAARSVSILRRCLAELDVVPGDDDVRNLTKINLGMALTFQAHALRGVDDDRANRLLDESDELLNDVYDFSFRLGSHPDAAAAALQIGIVSAIRGRDDEEYWFARSVAAAARGAQIETLWRAHVNLATAMYRRASAVTSGVRDHATAALEIMNQTLSYYSEPDQSPRFGLLRVPLATAVSYLIKAGDAAGVATLERYPALRASFTDPLSGALSEDRGGGDHRWLRIGDGDYVLF